MYKLLIIEDEGVIRHSLVNNVDWKSVNCMVIGETDNGDNAIELINKLKPDIVISDIRIYGRDGIQVCKYVHENLPHIKTVIITGYNEFNYAHSAVKYGINDFILKPTDPEELLKSVKRLTGEIDFDEQRKQQFIKLEKIMEDSLGVMREKFLIDLCNNNMPDSEQNEMKLNLFNIDLKEYYAVAMEIDHYKSLKLGNSENQIQLYKIGIRENINNVLEENKNGYFIEIGTNLSVILFKEKQMKNIIELVEKIQKNITNYYGVNTSYGISLESANVFKLNNFFEQAVYALRYKYYTGSSSIIYFGDINNKKTKEYVNLFSSYALIADCVRIGNSEGALKGLNKLWQDVRGNDMGDEKNLRTIALELIVAIQNAMAINNLSIEKVLCNDEFYQEIIKCTSLNQVDENIKNIIITVVNFINKENNKNNNALIKRIYEYISNNFSQAISLEDLSKEFYMNPNYLCRLIKKGTGENFTDILTKIRIEKAKELINNPHYKTYEIAQMVGINDSRYFSQMFKKIVGITPSEYRNKVN